MRISQETVTLGGHELLLRNAEADDAQMLLTYLKTTAEETRFLLKEPEELVMTLEDEKNFIESQNASDSNLMILGFLDGEHVGNCSLMGNPWMRYRHRVTVAIALYQKFTGLGIGTLMMKKLTDVAREHGIEQLELEVVADNERAVALYKKLGFQVCGQMPKNMKYKDGTYADVLFMVCDCTGN
ncbi:MAG TPA: GNAT family N-acetyltransferase [Candidatus Fusicatenibacter intestinigallinarum]|uniref:GNAT family N-acetyltransferase n=1 Tax=Candidatus Fusicatenibacter intestinigallinarum TaxID=2838598 RepID=A0A9D2NBP4_9FIRM|nr:GNAT family N-acetyltransferase [Candidatus Fusicatenibacter intestinigallinarum]